MSEITDLWEAIEGHYAAQGASRLLNPGASVQALDALEHSLGTSLPSALRESLSRHDGSSDSGWPHGELLSIERMLGERDIWMDLLRQGTFSELADFNAGHPEVQAGWWHAGWLPLDADGAGNGAFVDLAPGPLGTVGQVRDMDHEVGPGVESQSLADYLQGALEALESGEQRYYRDPDGHFEGLCAADELDYFERGD